MEFIKEESTLINIARIKEWNSEDQINEVVKSDYYYDDSDDLESEDLVMFGVGGPG
jgi:hypothetical protein